MPVYHACFPVYHCKHLVAVATSGRKMGDCCLLGFLGGLEFCLFQGFVLLGFFVFVPPLLRNLVVAEVQQVVQSSLKANAGGYDGGWQEVQGRPWWGRKKKRVVRCQQQSL